MEGKLKSIFLGNLPRKLFAVLVALAIWVYVSYSITETKVFPRMPVRIVNLPQGQTIRGLLPNGFLDQRLSVTLTGTKELLDRLDKKDFEIVIDASDKGEEWIVHLDKRNLVSTNPDIDLIHNISAVANGEMIIKLSKLVTEKVPVFFRAPKGEPPQGYQFLDIFPQKLTHTVAGPEEDVKKLQEEGLELVFDLSLIKKEELDALRSTEVSQSDEISFQVPDSWKKVAIPFKGGIKEEINSSEAKELHINFLRKDLLPIERDIAIWVFYPLRSSMTINPETLPLTTTSWITSKNGLTYVNKPLFVTGVSRVFLDIVRDWLEIVIIADTENKTKLRWEVQFVDPQQLEEQYVAALLMTGRQDKEQDNAGSASSQKMHLTLRERFLRSRFREYMQRFQLMEREGTPFAIEASQTSSGIKVKE